MRMREKKWRQSNQAKGRQQIACWLDGETHQALQVLILDNNLRGMAEEIRLLVDSYQTAQVSPHAAQPLDVNQDKAPIITAANQVRHGRCAHPQR